MTVATADVAFRDLGHHQRKRPGAHKTGDWCAFQRTIAMVEVQKQDVGLAAIDAGMRPQVVGHSLADS